MLKIPISESCHGPFSDLALPDSFWLHGRGSGCWLPGCGFNELLGWTSSCHHLWTFQDVPSHCEPSCSKNSGDCSLSNDSRSTWPHLNSAGQKAKYNAQTFSARCKVAAQPIWQHHHLGQQLDSWMWRSDLFRTSASLPSNWSSWGEDRGVWKWPQKYLTVAFFPPVPKMIEKWNHTRIVASLSLYLFE